MLSDRPFSPCSIFSGDVVRVVLHYGPTYIFILSTNLEIQALKHGNKTDFLMLDPVLNTPEYSIELVVCTVMLIITLIIKVVLPRVIVVVAATLKHFT